VLCAKPVIGDEPFAVILADDLIDGGNQGCLAQMVDAYNYHRCGIVAVENVPRAETRRYGIVKAQPIGDGISQVKSIVEKPRPEDAPSTLAVVGRYILPGAIMDLLDHIEQGAGGEIQLTDGIAQLLRQEQVLAYEFKGKRYDCGSKLGYLQATVEYALKHPELAEEFETYLQEFTLTLGKRDTKAAAG
jgi:UTP--glucose-1-phosphate uridylyltransferase